MRSLTIEQIVVFFLVIGLPLVRSIAGLIRKRNVSPREAEVAPSEDDQETSWLRNHDDNLPWSRSTAEKTIPAAPRATLRPAVREVSKVVPSTLRQSVWPMPGAPVERTVPLSPPRKKQARLPSAHATGLSVVRQVPREQIGQRRAIVLMAVFGPPRAIDPPA